jgi:hypothetical protein
MADSPEQPLPPEGQPSANALRAALEAAPDSEAESAERFDGEDFLFHLYRGSELLQDNCIEEAKEELERALALQPRDAEGQGLLGVVYFRLGLYPRAIQIYEDIIKGRPREITPRVNLGLCYLKTGQPLSARENLEEVVRRVPDHRRGWGYLGLAYERLGDHHKALAAFERAEQPQLVRRMQQLIEASSPRPESSAPERDEVRQAAGDAAAELDAIDGQPFERADAIEPAAASRSGRWRAVELGDVPMPAPAPPSLVGRFGPAVPALEVSVAPLAGSVEPSWHLFSPSTLASAIALELEGQRARPLGESALLVEADGGFVARLDSLRALMPSDQPFVSTTIHRRHRGRDTGEPIGALGARLVNLEGSGALVLKAPEGRRLVALELAGEFIYLRETRVLGFSPSARHESGRLAAGDGGDVAMLQLSGTGLVVVELRRAPSALAVTAERRVAVRADDVVGWTGRLLPQPIGSEQAPGQLHGFIGFSGDGAVLCDGS